MSLNQQENLDTRCGLLTLVGRPNVGKSTLLNALVGKKLSITSHKPQTTRQNLYGVKTRGKAQAVFIDTPGFHLNAKKKLNQWMNQHAKSALKDVDVIFFMIEAGTWHPEDEAVLKLLSPSYHVVLVINKVDRFKDKGQLLPFIQKVAAKFPFKDVVPLSAFEGQNLESLETLIFDSLPPNPFYFPEDMICSHNDQFHICEIIREKILRQFEKEVPYCTSVQIEATKRLKTCVEIHALIWVEREGQKKILIGGKGIHMKEVGIHARRDIEKLLGEKVLLKLWIKVKKGWGDSEKALNQLGYAQL